MPTMAVQVLAGAGADADHGGPGAAAIADANHGGPGPCWPMLVLIIATLHTISMQQ